MKKVLFGLAFLFSVIFLPFSVNGSNSFDPVEDPFNFWLSESSKITIDCTDFQSHEFCKGWGYNDQTLSVSTVFEDLFFHGLNVKNPWDRIFAYSDANFSHLLMFSEPVRFVDQGGYYFFMNDNDKLPTKIAFWYDRTNKTFKYKINNYNHIFETEELIGNYWSNFDVLDKNDNLFYSKNWYADRTSTQLPFAPPNYGGGSGGGDVDPTPTPSPSPTHDWSEDIHDSITDTTTPDLDNSFGDIDLGTDSSISDLVLLPITFLRRILDLSNG